MIPYARHTATLEDERAVLRVLRNGPLTQGPEVAWFEDDLCRVSGARFAVVVANGTVALELLYLALPDPGPITVPAITFLATANAAVRANRDVTFRDCDAQTGLMRPALASRTAVFVTLGGQPAPSDWSGIVDAAHGPIRHLPTAVATTLSFHPAKHVAAGEGGAVLTDDAKLAGAIRQLRDAGRNAESRRMVRLGTNGRLSDLHAALGRSQLLQYQASVDRRREIAARYDAAFSLCAGLRPVPHADLSARHLYQVLVTDPERRGRFRQLLTAAQVGTQIHYHPVPHEPWWRERDTGTYPGATLHAAQTVSLPLFPSLSEAQVEWVIEAVQEADRRC